MQLLKNIWCKLKGISLHLVKEKDFCTCDKANYNKRKLVIILFLTAFIIRFFTFLFFDGNKISLDGVEYHCIAVNLVKGNGFSNQNKEPFEKAYFREPGYPVFLAAIYSVVNFFHPIQYIENYNLRTYKLDKQYTEINVAKIIQILLASISIVVLFSILSEISQIKIAFLTGLFTAVYFNIALQNLFILRETLVVFLLLMLNFFYLKLLFKKNKKRWLILTGFTVGILILVFQVHAAIIPVLFMLLILYFKDLKRAFKYISIITSVAILVILPRIIIVYNFYPDIRTLKTFGSSFTYEMIKYDRAVSLLAESGTLSQDEANKMREWNRTSKEQFDKSFNGYYSHLADSLFACVPTEKRSALSIAKRTLGSFFMNFRKSFFFTKIGYERGIDLLKEYGFLIIIPLIIIPVLIGLFGILGLLMFWKRYLIYNISFVFYLLLFWMLGSEYRRMIILQPFLIFFALLFLNKILKNTRFRYWILHMNIGC
jgi:hypothetical protein